MANHFGFRSLYLFNIVPSKFSRNVVQGVLRGRHPHQFTIKGKVKAFYKRRTIYSSLFYDFCDVPHDQCHKAIEASVRIQKAFRRFLSKIARALAREVLNSNVELFNDIITSEPLHSPFLINSDWNENNKVLYNMCTLASCPVEKHEPAYVISDHDGNEHVISRTVHEYNAHGCKLFKSPMTRNIFTFHEITCVEGSLWYQIARAAYRKPPEQTL